MSKQAGNNTAIALVTGAATGIGLAISTRLIERGFRVVITDQNAVEGAPVAQRLGADFFELDVTQVEAWRRVESALQERYGKLNVLVNNAGIYKAGSIEDASLEDWHHLQSVNVSGVFLGCQTGIRLMKKDGGAIINLSSGAALRPASGAALYSATKSAVWSLTRTTALYCAEQGYNIRCNSVHPGMVDTQMVAGRAASPEAKAQLYKEANARHPLGRMASADDVARVVAFLASDDASYMTGAAVPVDGGYAIA